MRRLVRRAATALAALILAAGMATAAAVATARPAHASIFGPCNSLQHGDYRWFGKYLYECVYIAGLGGYYWVRVTFPGCGATRTARLHAC